MTTTRTEDVAARVREALAQEGYSGKAVAEKLELSPGQVSRLLSGKSAFHFRHLQVIGAALNVDPRRFLGLDTSASEVFLTVAEAAAKARRHPETIRKAIHGGELDSTQRVPRGRHLVRTSDLDAWIAGVR